MEKEVWPWLEKVVVKKTWGQYFADHIARALRSWYFVISQMAFISLWIAFNHFFPHWSFDDSGFNILRLVLTIEASFTGSVLLMSHSRHSEIDRKIMYNDYLVDIQILEQMKQIRPMIEEIHKRADIEKR